MMKKPLMIALLAALAFACEENCTETENNAVLSENQRDTEAYQRELASLLQQEDQDKVAYFFEELVERDGQRIMVVNAIGPRYCGELQLLIHEDVPISRTPNDTIGFKSAEVEGLRYRLPGEGFPVLEGFEELDD